MKWNIKYYYGVYGVEYELIRVNKLPEDEGSSAVVAFNINKKVMGKLYWIYDEAFTILNMMPRNKLQHANYIKNI
jgi:hypothetical protein